MTAEEQMLWQFVEDESNELILTLPKTVEHYGYSRESTGPDGSEVIALKILSAAMVKMLAVLTERVPGVDLSNAYMQLVPLHVELIKVYMFRALDREIK